MVVVNLVYGLTLPLLSLVLDAQGYSKTMIGLSIVAQASAGVLLAPVMSKLIMRFGAARSMQFATLISAVMLMLLGLTQDAYAWLPLRFILGAAGAMLWSASETVINELAGDDWRGRIIGIYGSAGAAGFALGPLILIFTGTTGLLPFIVTASFVVAASLPLLWLPKDAAVSDEASHTSLMRIFKLVPHIMLLNLAYAAAVEAFIAFFPLFGLHIGLGEVRSLSLLTVFALGGVVLTIPLGWLADHMDKYKLLFACILLTVVGFIMLPSLVAYPVVGPVFSFLLGGFDGMVYVMGVILLGQKFRGAELAAASVLYTGMWGAGTMLGPAIIGAGMDIIGNQSMAYMIAAIYIIYLPVLVFADRDKR